MRNGTLTQKSCIELDETKNAIKLAEKTEEEPKKKRFPLFSFVFSATKQRPSNEKRHVNTKIKHWTWWNQKYNNTNWKFEYELGFWRAICRCCCCHHCRRRQSWKIANLLLWLWKAFRRAPYWDSNL